MIIENKEVNLAIDNLNSELQKIYTGKVLFSLVIFDENSIMLGSNTTKELSIAAMESVVSMEREKKLEPEELH